MPQAPSPRPREQFRDRHDQRGVAQDLWRSVDEMSELAQRLHAVFSLGLCDHPLESVPFFLAPGLRDPRRGLRRRRGARTTRPRSRISANEAIALWYEPHRSDYRLARCFAENPRSRPAISKLAARRLTSHSQGPGSVSSKSLMSNTMWRSAEAKPPKFERWASPHSCMLRPETGRIREVGCHDVGRAPVEGKRRYEHPAVADWNEFGYSSDGLLFEQVDRVRPARRRSHALWLLRGIRLRASLPRAACSSGVRC